MARTIGPGTPSAIEPVNVKIPDIDLSDFDKLGDQKIKSATQNFQLYATTTANAEAQKAYAQYKDNPIALANALSKLPGMFKDLPESIQAELKQKLDTNAISLVTKAQANQEKAITKQNKALAHANAMLGTQQIADDYFNVLRYITSPEEEKRPVDLAIYRQHRQQLEEMTGLTDENGNPLFTETQRAKMLMPKEATLAGFKQFINRMELQQLQDWDKNIFVNQGKFMEDTGIDADTYESMNTAIKARTQALENEKTRGLHGQAYFDQVNLISEPTQLNLEKAKAYDFTDKKALDKAVKNAKSITEAKYYDPTRRTAPDAFVAAYNLFADAITNNDWSPEGREHAVAQTYVALGKLDDWAKETNMPPETTKALRDMIVTALTDKEMNQLMQDTGFAKFQIGPRERELREIGAAGDPIGMGSLREYKEETEKTAFEEARLTAMQNYGINLQRAIPYFRARDIENFKTAVAYATQQAKRDLASFIVSDGYEWDRLERELATGKKPIYKYFDRVLEFKGFDNKGAVFQEIF